MPLRRVLTTATRRRQWQRQPSHSSVVWTTWAAPMSMNCYHIVTNARQLYTCCCCCCRPYTTSSTR